MIKTFTKQIPDELFVDNFSEGKTLEYSYDGPDTLDVAVARDGSVSYIISGDAAVSAAETAVTIDAAADTDVAHYINCTSVEYTYNVIDNHDGSTHEEFANPMLRDIYELNYVDSTWVWTPITKDTDTQGEIRVHSDMQRISGLADVALDDADDAVYTTYINAVDAYLTEMDGIFPWRYVEITTPTPPKLPMSLIRLAKELEV